MHMLPRILRAPLTLAGLVFDRWVGPWWLRLQGVTFEGAAWMQGAPSIRMMPGGRIHLARGVKLYSRNRRFYAPCSLELHRPGARIEIGEGSMLSGTVLMASASITLGRRVFIGMNCHLLDSDFHPLDPAERRRHPTEGALSRPIEIGDDVFIGAGVIVLKGTRVGSGCVIGAGSVVSGTFLEPSIIAGNPARVVRSLQAPQAPRGAPPA